MADEDASRSALDKRSRKVKKALLEDLGEVSAHVEQQIDRLQQQANAKIMAIMADESLTDAEKRKKIEELDASTRLALSDLIEEQVLAERRVTDWAEENSAVSLEAGEKLAGLEKLLKADQFRWLKTTVQQKIDLRHQADGLVSTLDGLLKMIEEESKANGGKMTKRRAMQLQIFRALREDLEPLVRDRAAAAEEAKKIAWLAAARASGDVTESICARCGFSVN